RISMHSMFSIPRDENKQAYRSAAVGADFDIPSDVKRKDNHPHIKVVVRPSIPDNNTNWQVFDSDEQI
ncbi:hypothetical protein KI387_020626, partial [Taxus chinensis]